MQEFRNAYSQNRFQNKNVLNITQVEDYVSCLLYLNGETVVTFLPKTQIDLVIKKAILMKVFNRSQLIDLGYETNEFEVSINDRYGNGKHCFNFGELNDIIIHYATIYFPVEYTKDPKLLLSLIIKMGLIPSIEYRL